MFELLFLLLIFSTDSAAPASKTNEVNRSVLPDDVQTALTVLNEETLMPSNDIFSRVLLFTTFAWAETACEWIEVISSLLGDECLFFSSVKDVDDIFKVSHDVEDALCFWCDDDC